MPFTFAHPAIILPLNYLPKKWISLTGLVIGSLTPDFEYFIRMKVESLYSHTLPGLFWFDLPLGLVLFFVYQHLIKNIFITYLPNELNIRLSAFKCIPVYSLPYLIIIIASILAGAASHLFWDALTHPAGYFVANLSWLRTTITLFNHHVYIYKIAQHSSTLIGLTAIAFTLYYLPKGNYTSVSNPAEFWLPVFIIFLITIILRYLSGLSFHAYGNWIVTCIAGCLMGLIIASLFIRFVKQLKV